MMASESSEDEDLKVAIAMSLAEQDHRERPNVIDLTGSEKEVVRPDEPEMAQSNALSLLGLDRKVMEAERLARLARKRERSVSPPAIGSRKAPKLSEDSVSLSSGATLKSFSSAVKDEQRGRKSEIANTANDRLKSARSATTIKEEPQIHSNGTSHATKNSNIQYPNGVIKKTWAFGCERTGNEVKLEEVLEPYTLRTAVLSAFQWDMEWVLAKLKTPQNGGSTKCVFVMQAKEEELRNQMLEQTENARSWLRLCFPPMYTPINCMHSKLMLLFHEEKLRIAIPTANLLNFDWGETGVMENSVFMIDLPRLSEGKKCESEDLTYFVEELIYFLKRQQVDRDIREGLLSFDFTATKGMAFIHTVGGTHYREEALRTGLPGLSQAVRELSLQSQDDLEIDFAASSIGSLNDEYLQHFHAAARGEDIPKRIDSINSKSKTDFFKPGTGKTVSSSSNIRDKLRIYFPTQDTVRSSRAGSAGMICLNRKWFESAAFPKACFRDYRSTRKGLLSHNKILYARGNKADADRPLTSVAWAYVGSSNMSESAWGKILQDKKDKAFKVVCRNWECGVLLPVSVELLTPNSTVTKSTAKSEKVEGEDSETESEDEGRELNGKKARKLVDIAVFDSVVQPPFEIPGARYGGKQPWYFMERPE